MVRRAVRSAAVLLTVLAVLAVGTYILMNSRSHQIAGRLLHRVDTDRKVVALTIDDGPTERTPAILDTLCRTGCSGDVLPRGRRSGRPS
ncbi:polysaccharide deacetylase family protein [Nocardia vermiculata]|uniref:polysaccharide deacetylase family protein n=1 Tax=Nocardia vermiculata TaxID=257274 RepID=UPI0027D7B541|nr:polysaccharide deacetylase family protein [Nocardia vermiculata]